MMRTLLRTRLRPMCADDIGQIVDIERESFPSSWPQTAYRRELTNPIARYTVLCQIVDAPPPPPPPAGLWGTLRRIVGSENAASGEPILGFIGVWLMVGEAHVVTVAVREEYRRMGIGERLLISAIEQAAEYDQESVTLEVRASNEGAQLLYEKYGFRRVGLRKRYYTDNNEDAVLMTTPDLSTPAYGSLLEGLRARHRAAHPDLWA
jgi:ribosomal-protein-alanine N-acetyltransferase